MPDELKPAGSQTTENADGKTGTEESSLLDGEGKVKAEGTVLDEASKQEQEKVHAAEEELLKKEDKDLSPEDKTKKDGIVKARADAEKVKAEKTKAEAVPEKYEFKAPEGMTIDQAMVDKVSPVFKELGLNQAKAQKLVDFYADTLKSMETQRKTDFDKFVEDSKAETIKALGPKYKEEMAFAAKTKERFLSPGTMEKLRASGLANDKDVISDLIRIGRAISEDKFVAEDKGKEGGEGPAKKMYPEQEKK